MDRPVISNQEIPDPMWLAGFTSGEGCFLINFQKSQTHKVGEIVNLVFQLAQHIRDEQLIKSFINYLGCGKYYVRANKDLCEIRVTRLDDITHKIIPLFKLKYPIVGVKALDFADFMKVAELMKDKKHLTLEGLEQIRKIKAGMNTVRK